MEILVTPQAQKQIKLLPVSQQKKITKKILILESTPLAGKKLSGHLSSSRSLKAWPYRIIYFIDNAYKKIWITSVLHRQGVYK